MTLDDVDVIYIYDEWGYFKALSKVPNIPVETDTSHVLVGNDDQSLCFVSPDALTKMVNTGDFYVRPVFYNRTADTKRVPGLSVMVGNIPCHVIDAFTLLCDKTYNFTEEFVVACRNGFNITDGSVFDAFSKLLSTDKFRKKLMEA